VTETSADDYASRDRLTRVETKLDILIADLTPRHRDNDDRHRAADARLRAIEVAVSEMKTKIALISALAGAGAGVITGIVAKLIGV